MKTSEIFEACIPILENYGESYICHAITRGVFGNIDADVDDEDAERAVGIIRELCEGGFGTLMCPVYAVFEACGDIFGKEGTPPDMRYIRIELLKSLVKEYKLKGD